VVVSYTMKDEHGAESSSTVTITITGTNDAATISVLGGADLSPHDGVLVVGSVSEDAGSGIIEVDLDATDVDGSAALSIVGSAQGTYGSFQLVGGALKYTLANSSAPVQALNTGDVRYDSVTVKTADGTQETFKVKINGLNDAPPAPAANNYVNNGSNDFDDPTSMALFSGHAIKQNAQGSAANALDLGSNGNNNTFVGSNLDDFILGARGQDTIHGAGGNDSINGGLGVDRIYGGEGNDTLLGSNGADSVYGGSGNDRIISGLGADQLWGGTGADVFVFTRQQSNNQVISVDSNVTEKDTIRDFSRVEGDKIDVSGLGITASAWMGFLSDASQLQANKLGYIVDANGKMTIIGDLDGNASTREFELDVLGSSNLLVTDFNFML
jgi:VCBS repeat-containing protein